MILIVGPSGAGKDSLIRELKKRIGNDQRYQFVQRVVTRPVDTSSEDHVSMTLEEFQYAKCAGKFAVTWQAHGLNYGIPASVWDHLSTGGIAIANGSRQALDLTTKAFPDSVVVSVIVKPEVLYQRLVARGRECEVDIRKRLDRPGATLDFTKNMVEIDNSGPLDLAVDSLVNVVVGR